MRSVAKEMTMPTKSKMSKGVAAYWAKMTPEQRSAEMRRRVQLGMKQRKKKEKKRPTTTRPTKTTRRTHRASSQEEAFAFVAGRAVQFVHDLAEGYAIPRQLLAERVVELLRAPQMR